MSDADAREEFDINVFGTLNVIRNVLPQMRTQGCGHIFNVSSLGAYNVGPLSGIYCATKHAVKAISETLAQEVKAFNIHVTDVKPGFMRTEFFGPSHKTTAPKDSSYKHLYDKNMEFYMGQTEIRPVIQRRLRSFTLRSLKWLNLMSRFRWEQTAVMVFGIYAKELLS